MSGKDSHREPSSIEQMSMDSKSLIRGTWSSSTEPTLSTQHLHEDAGPSEVGQPFPEHDRVRELKALKKATGELLEVLTSENLECGSCVGKMTEMPNLLVCGNPSHIIIATRVRELQELIAST